MQKATTAHSVRLHLSLPIAIREEVSVKLEPTVLNKVLFLLLVSLVLLAPQLGQLRALIVSNAQLGNIVTSLDSQP